MFAESTRDVALLHASLLVLPGNSVVRSKEKKTVKKSIKESQNCFILIVKVRKSIRKKLTNHFQ